MRPGKLSAIRESFRKYTPKKHRVTIHILEPTLELVCPKCGYLNTWRMALLRDGGEHACRGGCGFSYCMYRPFSAWGPRGTARAPDRVGGDAGAGGGAGGVRPAAPGDAPAAP